ncbi:hypothetical protein OAO87_01490 [bacterium]|nr:hypothetical protein [bacterium]
MIAPAFSFSAKRSVLSLHSHAVSPSPLSGSLQASRSFVAPLSRRASSRRRCLFFAAHLSSSLPLSDAALLHADPILMPITSTLSFLAYLLPPLLFSPPLLSRTLSYFVAAPLFAASTLFAASPHCLHHSSLCGSALLSGLCGIAPLCRQAPLSWLLDFPAAPILLAFFARALRSCEGKTVLLLVCVYV